MIAPSWPSDSFRSQFRRYESQLQKMQTEDWVQILPSFNQNVKRRHSRNLTNFQSSRALPQSSQVATAGTVVMIGVVITWYSRGHSKASERGRRTANSATVAGSFMLNE